MKNNAQKLPEKVTRTLYAFKNNGATRVESTSTATDATTTCTTVLTTTHFNKQ
jgi:hypothetical protein